MKHNFNSFDQETESRKKMDAWQWILAVLIAVLILAVLITVLILAVLIVVLMIVHTFPIHFLFFILIIAHFYAYIYK